jgi:nucleoside-diphosphate-sugar epimerase
LLVNTFAYQAYYKKKITINGGKQIRPIIHIQDLLNCYEFFINNNNTGTFNISYENKSVLEIAKMVSKIIPTKLSINNGYDLRSYRMDNSKLKKLGFKFNHSIEDAVHELKQSFSKGFKPDIKNWNLKWLLKNKYISKN